MLTILHGDGILAVALCCAGLCRRQRERRRSSDGSSSNGGGSVPVETTACRKPSQSMVPAELDWALKAFAISLSSLEDLPLKSRPNRDLRDLPDPEFSRLRDPDDERRRI